MNIYALLLTILIITSNIHSMDKTIYSLSNMPIDIIKLIIPSLKIRSRSNFYKTCHQFHELDENSKKQEKFYKLLYATQRKNYVLIEELLKNGVNPNEPDRFFLSPLTIARKHQDFRMIKLLKNYGCENINLDIGTLPRFAIAVYTNDIDTLKECLDNGEYYPEYRYTHYDKTGELNPLAEYTVHHVAASIDAPNIIEMLLNQCKDVKIKNKIINIRSKNGNTPLHIASIRGHIKCVKILIAHDEITINMINKDDKTPLYLALENQHIEIANTLNSHTKYDVNKKYSWSNTQLHIAAQNGNAQIIEFLLAHNADAMLQDDFGNTALHTACEYNKSACAGLLLKCNPLLINIQNKKGKSPLHIAVNKATHRTVQILLQTNNIKVNTRNNEGYTPLDMSKYRNQETINLLIQYGAKYSKDLNSTKK